ncbi:hypothetical protein ET33_06400 [Paenibacillus tyrfis]|uniref:Uncharacterized protein n=1 Tax=Paenibacillus tyrfis TaxID=1501230 RepID=A0A081P2R0_9BACL|nr:hypothetical protein ET33_06400 [Paenibacillus tyrfis]
MLRVLHRLELMSNFNFIPDAITASNTLFRMQRSVSVPETGTWMLWQGLLSVDSLWRAAALFLA